jgi:hypothetical protein
MSMWTKYCWNQTSNWLHYGVNMNETCSIFSTFEQSLSEVTEKKILFRKYLKNYFLAGNEENYRVEKISKGNHVIFQLEKKIENSQKKIFLPERFSSSKIVFYSSNFQANHSLLGNSLSIGDFNGGFFFFIEKKFLKKFFFVRWTKRFFYWSSGGF